MSHTEHVGKISDTNIPRWLVVKLLAKKDPQSSGLTRQAQKRQWRRDMEMELSA